MSIKIVRLGPEPCGGAPNGNRRFHQNHAYGPIIVLPNVKYPISPKSFKIDDLYKALEPFQHGRVFLAIREIL